MRKRTIEAHWRVDPITQIIPDNMIVFFLPIRSASWVTASAPIKDPAGIAATMPPCAVGSG